MMNCNQETSGGSTPWPWALWYIDDNWNTQLPQNKFEKELNNAFIYQENFRGLTHWPRALCCIDEGWNPWLPHNRVEQDQRNL